MALGQSAVQGRQSKVVKEALMVGWWVVDADIEKLLGDIIILHSCS